jgi:regulatory protein SWI6
MEVNGVAVMRRRSDSWLNATQILKVAGVEKGKRTKVLEKEILSGDHEKVQGGYGKYQGTWINYRRGVEFCHQYGVEELLRPLLEYDLSQDGMTGMQGSIETPTKEQAMAAQRKRMYNPMESRPMTQSSNGTFFKNMSTTAANAVNALNKTRYDSPGRGLEGRRSVGPRRSSQQAQASQESLYPGGSQHSMLSLASQDSFSGTAPNGGSFTYGSSFTDFPNTDAQAPPRKRPRLSPQDSFGNNLDPGLEMSMRDGSPTEPNESFYSQNNQSFIAPRDGLFGLEPLPPPRGPVEARKKEPLLDLFIKPDRTDFADHPAFLTLSGEDFEIPIDDSCNTALHWAATLARLPLVRHLLAKGFNVGRTNSGGETALVAACRATNNHDHNSFPELLELLGPCIEIRDGRGRTLLHHIAVFSAMRGRAGVGRYYLESLLEFVVRRGSAPSSQEQLSSQRKLSTISLGRFMSEIVNAQDKSGDTALNLAARTSTRTIIDQLLEVGADPHIGNNGGLAPVDFGVVNDTNDHQSGNRILHIDNVGNGVSSTQTSFAEAQSEILTCKGNFRPCSSTILTFFTAIQDVLNASDLDFSNELREKQDLLDNTNRALKDSSNALVDERRQLEELQAKSREKDELKQKIQNLKRSASELRSEISQGEPELNGVMDNVPVGEADKGLDFDGRLEEIPKVFPGGDPSARETLTQEQMAFLASLDLERAEVLSGRVQAYQQHNEGLEQKTRELKSKSRELEERYKKIVSLCTKVGVESVDQVLDSLLQAVVSEQKENVELGRVREFLMMVQSVGEE